MFQRWSVPTWAAAYLRLSCLPSLWYLKIIWCHDCGITKIVSWFLQCHTRTATFKQMFLPFWVQWFLENELGLWDLSRTLRVLLSRTFSLQFLGIREGYDMCFSDAYSPLWAAARITEVENKEDSDNWGKYEKNYIMCLEPSTSTFSKLYSGWQLLWLVPIWTTGSGVSPRRIYWFRISWYIYRVTSGAHISHLWAYLLHFLILCHCFLGIMAFFIFTIFR